MTSARTVTAVLEQAFLQRFADGTASMLASSLDGGHAERDWTDRLRPRLGIIGAADASRPASALSYFTFPGGFAAVSRRSSNITHPGTAGIHALLGSSQQLTPAVALATRGWPGWQDEPPTDRRMPRLWAHELDAPDAGARLRARALAQGDLLAHSLAWLLQSPKAPLGLLGCPEQDRIALVWALLEIASPLLGQREWSFCTHGDVENGDPAAITFFDTPPARLAATDWIIVDLRRDQGASPQNENRANRLVYRYEYGVDPPDVDAVDAAVAPATAPASTAQIALPESDYQAQWAVAFVHDLNAAGDEASLAKTLTELEYAVAALDDRHEVRAALEDVDWAGLVISRRVPLQNREKVYDRIIAVAFGSGPATPSTQAAAQRLAASSQSDELVRALARAWKGDDLTSALAQRWINQRRPAAASDPTAGLGPVGRFFLFRGWAMTAVRERRLMVALLVLAVLLSCLAGLFAGRVIW